MLDIQFIKDNKEVVLEAIKNKKREPVDLDRVLELYETRKALRGSVDEINRARNQAAEIRDIEAGKSLKEKLQQEEEALKTAETELRALLLKIPNIPSPDTPIGQDETENKVVREWGEKPQFDFAPKAHWDLGVELGMIDNERAAKVSGARFTYLKGDLVFLQFALIRFAFDILADEEKIKEAASEAGISIVTKPFIPVLPPVIARPEVMQAMARLDPPEDKYYLAADNMYLTGSAEHTLGPLHMNETIPEKDLPLRYVGYSTAFRREAGAAGKDTRGILRMHQFDKIEIESFSLPEQSFLEQDFIVGIQEYMMRKLGLPYHVVSICTGDMGFPDQRQFDIETWMPGQDTYRETHTSDLIGGFQPRRLNTKVKRESGETEYLHMNDATVFAIGRAIVAIMENYQEKDGSIRVPRALVPYMGKDRIRKLV